MEEKQRSPTKEYELNIGNTTFTVKSLESSNAKQSIYSIFKRLILDKNIDQNT